MIYYIIMPTTIQPDRDIPISEREWIRVKNENTDTYEIAQRTMQRTNTALREAVLERDDTARNEVVVWGLEMDAKNELDSIIENEGFNSSACETAQRAVQRATIVAKKAIIDRDDAAKNEVEIWAQDMAAKAVVENVMDKVREWEKVNRR